MVFADGRYDRTQLHTYARCETGITLEIVRRREDQQGFHVLPKRWIVERTFAWLSRSHRLAKDYEHLPECSESWLYLASAHLLTKRLTTESAKQDADAA